MSLSSFFVVIVFCIGFIYDRIFVVIFVKRKKLSFSEEKNVI